MTAIYGQLRYRVRILEHVGDGADGTRYVGATAHYLPDGCNSHRERAVVVVGATLEYLAQVTDRPIADWLSDVVNLGDYRTLYEDQPDRISGLLPIYLLGDLIKRPPVHAAAVHAAVHLLVGHFNLASDLLAGPTPDWVVGELGDLDTLARLVVRQLLRLGRVPNPCRAAGRGHPSTQPQPMPG